MKHWLFLAIAILAEVVATSSLKASAGFTKFWPSLLVVLGYSLAFYFLSLTLKAIPIGIAYAIWAGLGIVLISLVGWLVFGQRLDPASIVGMALIIAGVVVINVFSNGSAH
jgi:small multidrug resistance pump